MITTLQIVPAAPIELLLSKLRSTGEEPHMLIIENQRLSIVNLQDFEQWQRGGRLEYLDIKI